MRVASRPDAVLPIVAISPPTRKTSNERSPTGSTTGAPERPFLSSKGVGPPSNALVPSRGRRCGPKRLSCRVGGGCSGRGNGIGDGGSLIGGGTDGSRAARLVSRRRAWLRSRDTHHRRKMGSPPLRGSHSLRTCSSTDWPVEVVGLRSVGLFSSCTGFGLYISRARWSITLFSRTCRRR